MVDLEVGTFRFGGMINHQQPGHGLGSAAGGGSYVQSQSVVVAEIPILLREFGNVVCFHALSFPSRYSLKQNKSNRCAFSELWKELSFSPGHVGFGSFSSSGFSLNQLKPGVS